MEMVKSDKIHGYLWMWRVKKILECIESPEEAVEYYFI